ncbi:MAG: hypothetical protein WCV86_03945 [Patescibacteria group bacterium]|jgi:hypothetical protein
MQKHLHNLRNILNRVFGIRAPHKRVVLLVGVLSVAVGVFFALQFVKADAGETVVRIATNAFTSLLAEIVIYIDKLLARLLVVLSNIMIAAASYNDFVNAPAVEKGWTIVRDLANMFFIVVLLVISFGTILRIQQYRFQQTLPRFIIWAVLINFSKFIAGVWIDFAQVITLTFVNAFRDAAAGNIVDAFGLREMLTFLNDGSTISADAGDVLGAVILSLALLIIANVVIFSLAITFLFRIVALWLLVVLSPIAYVTRTFPNATKYSDQWWTMFNKYVMTGPVLAFFIWLALTIIATPGPDNLPYLQGVVGTIDDATQTAGYDVVNATSAGGYGLAASISAISSSDRLLSFILSIGLFISALMATQQLGVMGSGVAGSALKGIQKGALGTARWVARRPGAMGSWTARKIKAGRAPGPLKRLAGVDFNPANFVRGVRKGMANKRIEEELEGTRESGAKARQSGGLKAAIYAGGTPEDFQREYMSGFIYNRGLQRLGMNASEKAESIRTQALEEKKKKESLEMLAQTPDPETYMENDLNSRIDIHEQELKAKTNQIEEGDTIEKRLLVRRDALEKLKKPKEGQAVDQNKVEAEEAAIADLEVKKQTFLENKKNFGEQWEEDRAALDTELTALKTQRASVFGVGADGTPALDPNDRYTAAMQYVEEQHQKKVVERDRVQRGGITDAQIEERKALIRAARQKDRTAAKEQDSLIEKKDTAHPEELAKLNAQLEELQKLREGIAAWMARIDDGGKTRLTRDDYKNHQQTLGEGRETEDERFKKEEIDVDGKKTGRTMGEALIKGLNEALTEDTEQLDAMRTITEAQREQYRILAAEAGTAQKKLEDKAMEASKWVFQDFSARAAGRTAASIAAKNVDTENEHELIQLFKSALNNDDKGLAEAVMREAAAVGHLNELVNAEGFIANQDGLNQFVNKTLVDKLGMDKQIAYGIQNDASEMAQRINHWTFAQSVGVKSGQYYQRTPYEQGMRSAVEMSKKDPEGVVRQSNRLGYGGEDPSGAFHISEVGLHMIAKGYKSIQSQFSRGRYNRSAAMKLVTPETFSRLQSLMYTDLIDDKRLYRKFLNELLSYAAGSADTLGAESRAVSRLLDHAVPRDLPNV